ncbi:hypothetical protein CTAYLR_000663 [Chrysophaeum taylorii]|uniref:Carrier domain-containing protein n=1 Tax=Chrysophaeum taylorii TaxID=2483200 RepID=A0AAD7U8M8_9STRA|nr:hypothetical protein CTAYLR_000663 [Chrysophaeum taylorii]
MTKVFSEEASVVGRFLALTRGEVEWEQGRKSYRELAADAQRVASGLVGATPMVCLYVERSYQMLVGIMGITSSGRAYVPTDVEGPLSRVEYVVKDSRADLLTTEKHSDKFPQALVMERLKGTSDSKLPRVAPKDALYCFYTSGTMGEPKGVVVEHFGLCNRIDFLQSKFPLGDDDAILQKTFFGFGVSEWEIFWPLLTGARMALAATGNRAKDPEYLLGCVSRFKITKLFCVPSQIDAFAEIDDDDDRKAAAAKSSVTHVFSAGEALRGTHVKACGLLFPSAVVTNLYGPTEGDMTYFSVPKNWTGDVVPAGFPISNSQVLVLDGDTEVKQGLVGEICFQGPGIARGYLNRPELTARSFVRSMYRTGDRGYVDRQGVLHFVGRVDRQVKVGGVRVELGEVEAGLVKAGAAKALAEIVGEGPMKRIVAWVTPLKDAQAIHEKVRTFLPKAYVPGRVVGLETFPLTKNDKVDRAKLKRDILEEQPAISFDDDNTLEGKILQVWARLVSLPAHTTKDSAFETLGATSLLIGRAATLLRKRGYRVAMTDFFVFNTANKLAKKIGHHHQAIATTPKIKRWQGLSSTRPLAILMNAFSFVLSLSTNDGLPAVIEFVVSIHLYSTYSFLIAWVLAVVVHFMVLAATVLFAVGAKYALLGNTKPGDYPIFSFMYLRWHTVLSVYLATQSSIRESFGDTPLMPLFYRLFGARIGPDCEMDANLYDPDMIEIGRGVQLRRKSVVSGHALTKDGLLKLRRTRIADYSIVKTRAFVVAGTQLNDRETRVGAMATTDGLDGIGKPPAGVVEPSAASAPLGAAHLKKLFCVPLLIAVVQLPVGIALYLMAASGTFDLVSTPKSLRDALWLLNTADGGAVWLLGFSWIFPLLSSQLFFWILVLLKKTVLKRRRRSIICNDEVRTWFLNRLVSCRGFDDAAGPYINTEVLAMLYRALGAKVGRRVQMDAFYALEHEFVTVGDNVVFGNSVTFETTVVEACEPTETSSLVSAKKRHVVASQVVIAPDSEVLDHCHLEFLSTVETKALVGSSTIVPRGYVVRARSTSMGNVNNAPVVLRRDRTTHKPISPIETLARRRHEGNFHWIAFNVFNVAASVILEPMVKAVWIFACGLATQIADDGGIILALAIFILVDLAMLVAEALFVCGSKWILIGEYKAGDYAFYGKYHYQWVVALLLNRSLRPLLETKFRGTCFLPWFCRIFGMKCGTDCCLMSATVEFDLLEFGDRCVVGIHSILQPHTVENMVIKLGPFKMGSESCVRHLAAIMPDSALEDNAEMLENSLLPKGCVCARGTTWAGLPAQEVTPLNNGDNGNHVVLSPLLELTITN